MSPDNVYAYFKEICTNSPLDITLYNIPVFASMIDVATVQRMSEECPKAVAIKDSSGDIAHMQRMIAAVKPNRPEFVFMTGYDPSLLPMMLIGCEGGTNCSAGLAPSSDAQAVRAGQAQRRGRSPQGADASHHAVRRRHRLDRLPRKRAADPGAARLQDGGRPLPARSRKRTSGLGTLRGELKQLLSRPEYQPVK